jgi:Tfp pilus assembly protein PilF
LTDPEHYSVHAKLARLYANKGSYTEAINGYRISIAGGHYSSFIFSQLAFLYLRIGKFKKAFNEIFQALKTIPSDLIDCLDDLKKKLKL